MTIGQDLTWWMDIEFSQMFTEENGKKTSWWWQQFDSKKKNSMARQFTKMSYRIPYV